MIDALTVEDEFRKLNDESVEQFIRRRDLLAAGRWSAEDQQKYEQLVKERRETFNRFKNGLEKQGMSSWQIARLLKSLGISS